MLEHVLKKRRRSFLKQILKYMRLMFNDHFTILLLFILGAGGYFYRELLIQLDSSTGVHEYLLIGIISLVIVAVMFVGKTPTYLEEADLLFLMPKLEGFKSFFKRFALERYAIKIGILFLLSMIFYPLFTVLSNYNRGQFLLLLVQLVLNTALVILNDTELNLHFENRQLFQNTVFLGILSFISIYVSLKGFLWIGFSLTIVFFLLGLTYFYYYLRRSQGQLAVIHLITHETERKQQYYRFFSLVTDVPNLNEESLRLVKSWPLIKMIFQFGDDPVSYLLPRLFFRKKSYSLLYLRLIIIGSILIGFSTQELLVVSFSLLFNLMILVQAVPIIYDMQNKSPFKLYQIKKEDLLKGLASFLYRLSGLVILVFTIIALFKGVETALIVFATNSVVLVLFNSFYLPGKLI